MASDMAFFAQRPWQFLTQLQMYCGVWPYQCQRKNRLIRVVLNVVIISSVVPPLLLILKPDSSPSRFTVTENILGTMLMATAMIKFFVACVNEKQCSELFERVNEHFRSITKAQEAAVLENSGRSAQNYTFKYINFATVIGILYMGLPPVEMLFRILVHGEAFDRTLPYEADYGIFDRYTLILLHIVAYGTTLYVLFYTIDLTYIMNMRHVCALFEIVNIRLREASGFLDGFEWDLMDLATANEKACELINEAIDLHKEALQMVAAMEEIYSFCFFLVLCQNSISFSAAILVSRDSWMSVVRYCGAFSVLLTHFYVMFSHGQMIIDAGAAVWGACCNVKWYLATKETRALLAVMMLQSLKPCKITGGRFFDVSLGTFCKMLKAGLSYFSVLTR